MTTNLPNSNQLFKDAGDAGELSPQAVSLLSGLSARIDRSMAVLKAEPTVTEQTLLSMMLDNTPSMSTDGNHMAVIDGHNLVVNAILDSRAVNSVEVLTTLINPGKSYTQHILGDKSATEFQWCALKAAPRLDEKGYINGTSTPLYDRCLETLGSVVARTKWWEDKYGIQTRSVTLLMTDGASNSGKATAQDVARIVGDMLSMEKHRIFFMGVKLAGCDFHRIGQEMGIPANCIDEVDRDPKAIRRKFQLFSQSAIAQTR